MRSRPLLRAPAAAVALASPVAPAAPVATALPAARAAARATCAARAARARARAGWACLALAGLVLAPAAAASPAAGPASPAAAAWPVPAVTAPASPATAPISSSSDAAAATDAIPSPLAVLVISGWDWQRVLDTSEATNSPGAADPAVATRLAALASTGESANLIPRTAAATPTIADGLATLTAGARAASPSDSAAAHSPAYDADPHALADTLASSGLTSLAVGGPDATLALTPSSGAPPAALSLAELVASSPPDTPLPEAHPMDAAAATPAVPADPASTMAARPLDPASASTSDPHAASRLSRDRQADRVMLPDLTLIDATGGSERATQGLDALAALRRTAARAGTEVRVVVVSLAEGSNDPQLLILPAGTTGWGGRWPVASPSTHQAGWVQLTDLAPTLLAALGAPVPAAMTGQPLALPPLSADAGASPAAGTSPAPGLALLDAAGPSLPTIPSAQTGSSRSGAAPATARAGARTSATRQSSTAAVLTPADSPALRAVRALADDAARARASHAVTLPMCLLVVALGLLPLLLAARQARRRVTARRSLRVWSVSLWGAALPAGAWLTSLVPWWRLVDPAPTGVAGGVTLLLVPGGIALGIALALVVVSLWATRVVGRLRTRRSDRCGAWSVSTPTTEPAAPAAPATEPAAPTAQPATHLGTSAGPPPRSPSADRSPLPATGVPAAQVPPASVPAALIGAVTAALILVDAATGARLGFNGTLGMDAVVAGRFYGASNTAFALAAAALIVAVGLGAGPWAVSARRWSRPVRAAVAVGAVALVALGLDALPVTGADVGGGLTLVVTLGVLAVALAGVRLRARHLLGLAVGAAAVMSGLGLADWVTGPRTHLGRLAGQLVTGQVDDAAATLTRKLTSLIAPFASNRLALVALVVGVAALAAAGWWLRRQVGVWRTGAGGALGVLLPAPGATAWQWLRPTLLALTVLIVVEVCVNDSGASMAWLSLAQASPLLVAALPARVAPPAAEQQPLATAPA